MRVQVQIPKVRLLPPPSRLRQGSPKKSRPGIRTRLIQTGATSSLDFLKCFFAGASSAPWPLLRADGCDPSDFGCCWVLEPYFSHSESETVMPVALSRQRSLRESGLVTCTCLTQTGASPSPDSQRWVSDVSKSAIVFQIEVKSRLAQVW